MPNNAIYNPFYRHAISEYANDPLKLELYKLAHHERTFRHFILDFATTKGRTDPQYQKEATPNDMAAKFEERLNKYKANNQYSQDILRFLDANKLTLDNFHRYLHMICMDIYKFYYNAVVSEFEAYREQFKPTMYQTSRDNSLVKHVEPHRTTLPNTNMSSMVLPNIQTLFDISKHQAKTSASEKKSSPTGDTFGFHQYLKRNNII